MHSWPFESFAIARRNNKPHARAAPPGGRTRHTGQVGLRRSGSPPLAFSAGRLSDAMLLNFVLLGAVDLPGAAVAAYAAELAAHPSVAPEDARYRAVLARWAETKLKD